MKLVTTEFKSGGLHEKHVVAAERATFCTISKAQGMYKRYLADKIMSP
jgi:hypothetical protein